MEESYYYDDIAVCSESAMTAFNAIEELITVRIELTAGLPTRTILEGSGFLIDAHLSDDIGFIKNCIWLKTGLAPRLCITFLNSPNAYR
jgi:hypothetical protein